jgi:hypothetical protein
VGGISVFVGCAIGVVLDGFAQDVINIINMKMTGNRRRMIPPGIYRWTSLWLLFSIDQTPDEVQN